MTTSRKHFVGQLQLPNAPPQNVEFIANERPDITSAERAAGIEWVDSRYEPGNVLRYGAVGDGVTDDTTAIQTAINSTHDVSIPASTYVISNVITMDNAGQRMVGEGKAASIIKQTVVNTNGINIAANDVYIGHLQVRDITQDDANEYHAILWADVDGTTVEHCKIDTSDDAGIRCGYDSGGADPGPQSTNSRILNNDITNITAGHGIEIIGAFDVLCEGNDIEGTSQHGIRINGSSRVRCATNNIEHWAESGGGEGIFVSGGTVPGPIVTDATKNIVTGNILRLNTSITQTSSRTGILLAEDAVDCIVSNNFIDMTDSTGDTNINGIWCRDTSAASEAFTHCTISDNIITGDMEVGIKMVNTSSGIKILGNTIEGFNDSGIVTGTTTDLIINDNTLVGAQAASAIDFNVSVIDAIVSNNIISDCGRAFNLRGVAQRCKFTDNTAVRLIVTGGTAYGFNISVSNGKDMLIANNHLSNIGAVSGDSFQYANIAVGASDRVSYYDNIVVGDSAATLVAFQAGTGLIEVRYAGGTQTLDDTGTPTVDGMSTVKTGGTTTITDFDDGVTGQELLILSAHAITITDGAPIILAGGANFVMKASDTLTLKMIDDQVWNEVSRSVN